MNDLTALMQKLKCSDVCYDMDAILLAYQTAANNYQGVVQKSGEPYIIYPVSVAMIIADTGIDTNSVVAALLYDGENDITSAEICSQFGEDVAGLVDGVNRLRVCPSQNLNQKIQTESPDVRTVTLLLADRLHRTRMVMSEKYRIQMMETMSVYIAIAHNLGLWLIEKELEEFWQKCQNELSP